MGMVLQKLARPLECVTRDDICNKLSDNHVVVSKD